MSSVLQQGFKQRDPRIKVLLPSRMRVGSAWVDACIHNVSSRGMLVASDETPRPGSYVEIRRGRNVIIGRAVWTKGRFFGIRTQERVDLAALKEDPRAAGRRGAADASGQVERRNEDRLRKEAAVARALERNRAMARIGQFCLIALAAAAACVLVAATVYKVLIVPMTHIQQALGG